MSNISPPILVITGPTASGKSDLAILLARKYNGEIISADSRQVYRGMDIGTGKVTKREQRLAPHWLLDVASPKRTYNVTHFVRDAKRAIADVRKQGKIPIICGGTGFWIQALIEDSPFPTVKPNPKLRKELSRASTEELFKRLQESDPARARSIDPKNKIRLIRALEIISVLGQVPQSQKPKQKNDNYFVLVLNPPKETLDRNIASRLEKRLKKGMVAEVQRLRAGGISWKKLESFGLEYKYIALLLQKKISREVMRERLEFEIHHYAKRQLTWLRRFEKSHSLSWTETSKEAQALIAKTLHSI